MKTFDPLWIAVLAIAGLSVMVSVGVNLGMSALRTQERPADVQTHPVTCTDYPSAPNAVTCVGNVPIDLRGRRIRLVSEPMPEAAP